MKLATILVAIFASLVAAAQTETVQQPAPPGKGKIILLFSVGPEFWHPREGRPLLDLERYSIFLNDKLFCRMKELTYSVHIIDTGNYTIATQYAGKKIGPKTPRVHITVETSKVTYLQAYIDMKMFTRNLYIMPVSEDFGIRLQSKLMPLADCKTDNNTQVKEK